MSSAQRHKKKKKSVYVCTFLTATVVVPIISEESYGYHSLPGPTEEFTVQGNLPKGGKFKHKKVDIHYSVPFR